MKRYAHYFLLFIFIISCGEMKLPLKEMAKAKSQISFAYEVKADKYAPNELGQAKEELLKAHSSVKDDKDKKAKESAVKAYELATEAINKALPFLAEETINKAETSFSMLETIMAVEFAPENYNIAKNKLAEAKVLNAENKYLDAYKNALESISASSEAEMKALSQRSAIEAKIASIHDTAEEIKNNNGEQYASDELKNIEKNLVEAKSFLTTNNFVKTFEYIKNADESLEIALNKSREFYLSQKILSAKNSANDLKKSPLSKEYNKDFEDIDKQIVISEDLLKKKDYDNSTIEIDLALAKLDKLKIVFEKKAEELRLTSRGSETIIKDEKGFPKTYVVKYNPKNRDCLWKIAYRIYKDASLWPLIYITNRDQIKDPDLIFPGQTFIIPPSEKKKFLPVLLKKIRSKKEFGGDLEKEFQIYIKSQKAKKEEQKIIIEEPKKAIENKPKSDMPKGDKTKEMPLQPKKENGSKEPINIKDADTVNTESI